MALSIDSLHCFTAAARLLNFRAAARVVSLSPAALGQRIQQLEEDLGAPLFHRTTRAGVLTDAELKRVPYAQHALASVEECRRAARGELAAAPLEIVLGTRHELGLSWIVPMIPKLEAARPGLALHLYFGSGADLVARVRNLAIDCAVTSTRLVDPKLDSIRLHEEHYAFVGQPTLLRREPLRAAADAKRHTLFDTTEELPLFRYHCDARGGIDSLEFGRVVRMGTIAAIRARVLSRDGVAVLPEYFIARDLATRRLVRVLPKVRPP